jgi:hypothetical protein
MTTTPDTLTSARNERRRTAPPDQERTMTSADIPIEVIDDVECTNRTGLATITGLSPKTMSIYAGADEAFPDPIRGERINRTYWYPLTAAHAYAQVLTARAEEGKPPAVEAGDPNDLLVPDDAAAAIGVKRDTFKRYVLESKPYWDGLLEGRPLLPKPDEETEEVNNLGPYTARKWRRGTLAAHQAGRPGAYGNTAAGGERRGRPSSN